MFDKADFLDRVADILEVPEVIPEFEFRSAPGWGSMMGFALYVMLEDEYGVKITPERFRELKTVSGLMSECLNASMPCPRPCHATTFEKSLDAE